MNDEQDFLPEIRNSAWYSGDSRMAANGKAVEAILTKQGKLPIPDLSDIEAVQMGKIMQPLIGRLAQDRLGFELKDADYALTHSKEAWLKSHFDFISVDGTALVEAKNYNASVRSKFDPEENRVPPADYAQCLHEAVVHNVSKVYLAVLFGGQEFQTFDFHFSDEEKDAFIKTQAKLWACVVSNETPTPESVEQTKLVYPVSSADTVIVATQQVEQAIEYLRQVKAQVKELEEKKDAVELQIRKLMADKGEIRSVDGSTLVTWKSAKPSMSFSATLFKAAYKDLYDKFVVQQPGSRRFLVK
jgi:predicted phage-related endonuclease